MTVIDLVVCFIKVLSGLPTSLDDEDGISVFRPDTYTFNGTHIPDSDLRAITTSKSVNVHAFSITNVLTADVRIHPMEVDHIRLPGQGPHIFDRHFSGLVHWRYAKSVTDWYSNQCHDLTTFESESSIFEELDAWNLLHYASDQKR